MEDPEGEFDGGGGRYRNVTTSRRKPRRHRGCPSTTSTIAPARLHQTASSSHDEEEAATGAESEEVQQQRRLLRNRLLSILTSNGENDGDNRGDGDSDRRRRLLAAEIARASSSLQSPLTKASSSNRILCRDIFSEDEDEDDDEKSAPPSSSEILALSRKLIKEAAEICGNNNSNNKKKKGGESRGSASSSTRALDCLFVGIQGVRALLFEHQNRKESKDRAAVATNAIKLMYHSVTAAENAFHDIVDDDYDAGSGSSSAKPPNERRDAAAAATYCFAAYEVLGRFLRDSTLTAAAASASSTKPKKKGKQRTDAATDAAAAVHRFRNLVPSDCCGDGGDADGDRDTENYLTTGGVFDGVFVVPDLKGRQHNDEGERGKANRTSSPPSSLLSLSPEQATSIGILSTLAVARVVSKIISVSAGGSDCNEDKREGSMLSSGIFKDVLGTTSGTIRPGTSRQQRRQRSAATACHLLVHLLRNVLPMWISYLVADASAASRDCTRDILSHCKQSYSILWDAASRIDCKGSAREHNNNKDLCLLLRGEAVLAVLGADIQNLPSKIQSAVQGRSLESACTCSWKASVSYAQQEKGDKKTGDSPSVSSRLQQHHKRVGPVLDQVASTRCSDAKSGGSFAYVEYCAYRALHSSECGLLDKSKNERGCRGCGSDDCLFASCPYPYAHFDCGIVFDTPTVDSGNTAMLSLFYLCLSVRHHLSCSDDSCEKLATQDPPHPFLKNTPTIIERFRCTVFEGQDESCTTNRLRFHKMIWMISLHRAVFEVLESKAPVARNRSVLAIAAEILSDGIGPLAFVALEQPDAASKRNQLWDAASECYVRSVSILEALGIESMSIKENKAAYHRRSNVVMEMFVGLLLKRRGKRLIPSFSCVQKAAKFLAIVAKRRHEQEFDAVVPLLYSIQLFVFAGGLLGSSEQSLQLSARLSYLASIYKTRGLIDEAIIATAAALSCDIHEKSSKKSSSAENPDSDPHFHLFRSMGRFTKGIISVGPYPEEEIPADHRKGLVAKLVGLLFERQHLCSRAFDGDTSKASSITLTQTVGSLLLEATKEDESIADLFECSCGVPFSLGWILQVFLASSPAVTTEKCSSACSAVTIAEKMEVIVEVLAQLGDRLQVDEGHVDEEAPATHAFRHVLRLALYYLLKLCRNDDEARYSALSSALYVLASVSLVSNHPLLEFDRWGLDREYSEAADKPTFLLGYAAKLAQKAANSTASAPANGGEWLLVVSALKPAIALFQIQISDLQSSGSAVKASNSIDSVLLKTVDALSRTNSQASAVVEASRRCAISVLSRLCDSYHLEGEKLHAVQFASWNDGVSAGADDNFDNHSWFEATAVALQACDTVVSEDTPLEFDEFNILSPSIAEGAACRMRQRMRRSLKRDDLAEVGDALLTLMQQIDDSICSSVSHEQTALFLWSKSTCLVAFSELQGELCGRFDVGIVSAKECFQICQKLSSQIKKRGRNCESLSVPLFWQEVALTTMRMRCAQRQVDCFQLIAELCGRKGDWRKAGSYASSAITLARFVALHDENEKQYFSQMLKTSRSRLCYNSQEIQLRRLCLRLSARATPWDVVMNEFQKDFGLGSVSRSPSKNKRLEELMNIVAVEEMLGDVHMMISPEQLDEMHDMLESGYSRFVQDPDIMTLSRTNISEQNHYGLVAPVVFYNLKLHLARALLSGGSSESVDATEEEEAMQNCFDVIGSPTAPQASRAEALFHLGFIELQRARRKGELRRIWQGHSNVRFSDDDGTSSRSAENARKHFFSLLSLLGPSSDLLARKTLRCLALLAGPGDTGSEGVSSSAAALIHASIGSAPRQRIASLLKGVTESFENDGEEQLTPDDADGLPVADVFRALDMSFGDSKRRRMVEQLFSTLAEHLHPEWRIVASTVCPTGELLVCALERNGEDIQHSTVCIFPDIDDFGNYLTTSYQCILSPLDVLIKSSQDQLGANSEKEVVEDKDKREWWRKRSNFDLELQSLISEVECEWFGSESAQRVLCRDAEAHQGRNNLASKFEAASLPEAVDGRSCLNDKTYERKRESCTFLILDENLHRFPFEGMECLEGETVCRLPSLPFLVAKLVELAAEDGSNIATVDAASTTYILDPESNLRKTAERVGPMLKSWNTSLGGEWKGVVGAAPQREFLEAGLTTQDGLLLYFGHGSGQNYLSRSNIEGLIGKEEQGEGDQHGQSSQRKIQAAVVLMGCSSVKLETVNRRGTELVGEELPIYYEPEGIALSYLAAGAPCVVGNLWDVSDHDIDRFSVQMLESFFDGDDEEEDRASCRSGSAPSPSLANCVARSRSACKMRYLVGCAPVCYGVPVFRKRR